jgi:hypothetical protein
MKTFVVLGMHRSATSLAAKGLAKAGVCMGDRSRLLGVNASNKYGYWEDIDFLAINDKLLSIAGGSWDDPPPEKDILAAGKLNKDLIHEFIKSKEQPIVNRRHPFWGWKDPRTVLTIRCYMPYLSNPHFIACYRKPDEVAASLWERDQMPLEKGLALAKIYNERMAEFLREFVYC